MQTRAQKEQYKSQMEVLEKGVDGGKKKKDLVLTRCSPFNLFKVFEQLKGKKKDVVESVGFGPLLLLKSRIMRREMCQYLVENFDVASSSINFDGQSIAFTVEDVEAIIGLKNEGIEISNVMQRENGVALCKKYNIPRNISFVDLEKEILEFEVSFEDLKARVLLYIVGRFLSPTTEGGPSQEYYSCLNKDGLGGRLNWAKHAYEKLLVGITNFHRRKGKATHSYLTGCLLLLEIKFYDHICGIQSSKVATSTLLPRISAWGKDEDSNVSSFHQLKQSTEDVEELPNVDLQSMRDRIECLESNFSTMSENINKLYVKMDCMNSSIDTIKDAVKILLDKSTSVSGQCDKKIKQIDDGFIEDGRENDVVMTDGDLVEMIDIDEDDKDRYIDFQTSTTKPISQPSSVFPVPGKKEGWEKEGSSQNPKGNW